MTNDEFNQILNSTANDLSRIVNAGCDDDLKKLAEAMLRDHRTLLQAKMRLCLLFIEGLAKAYDEGFYDLRNEHACKVAKKICDTVDQYERYMPCI